MQGWLNKQKSIITDNIKKIKDKNHIISIDAENGIDR